MYHGSEEELRAAEMAGRVYDNLCTSTPLELHGIRQMHTSHIGGASLDGENESTCGSHNTSAAQPSQRGRVGGAQPPPPHITGVNAVVEVARRESVLRQLYNDKLRGSISAILSALMNELPRDHIFMQLLSDATTEQYCRVRVGEVVESFLFSVQAHQYHNLASELAKREVELLTLAGQLEEAQQANADAPPPPLKSFKATQTDNRIDAGMNTTECPTQPAHGGVEPAEAAAQEELIALLEDVTREHELAKCRECLSAPTSLLETVQAEGNYRDKYEYLADVVGHLFRSVQGLVVYADGSLASLGSLRHSLHGVWGRDDGNAADAGAQTALRRRSLSGNSAAAGCSFPSSVASSAAAGTSPVQPQQSPQQREAIFEEERARLEVLAAQLKYAQRHCGDVIEGLGKAQAEMQRQSETREQQLEQLQQLAARNNTQELSKALKANEAALVRLREELQQSFAAERAQAQERERELEQRCAQQASELQQVTEKLAAERQQLQREVEERGKAEQRMQAAAEAQRQSETREQQLEQLQQLAARNNAQELSKALKANEAALVRLREELQQSFAAERAQAQERERELEQRCAQQASELQQVTEKLAAERQQLQREVEERGKAEQRMQAAAEAQRHYGVTVSELQRDLAAERDALQAAMRKVQEELIARRAEAVCARLESFALDAQVAKMEFLLAYGYQRAAAEQHYSLLLAKEAVRHAQTQAATEQKILREHEAATQQCYEDLRSLLECMREDDHKAEWQQREEEADTEARRRRVSADKSTEAYPASGTNGGVGGAARVKAAEVEEAERVVVVEAGAQTQALLHRYGTPKTLTGVVTAMQNAYEAVQRHQRYMQSTVDAVSERGRQLQQEADTLRARLEQLMADYEQQRANFKRLWNERAMWEQQDTLKGLLAKQEALLATVNLEREALQVRWSTLSEEYQALERRNSQLHERCAVKEAENARLLGYLRATRITSASPTASRQQQQQQQPKLSPPEAVHDTAADAAGASVRPAAGGTTSEKAAALENSPEARRAETQTLPGLRGSRGSSSAAGLSGQARTPCSSVVEDEVGFGHSAVGVVVPLGQLPRDRGAWRQLCRPGRSAAAAAPATPTTSAEEEEEEKEENAVVAGAHGRD
ncbi:uncharacterized protein Tco025E_02691 [Trypanosoma conorhini]|uniref:Uncharacterized protein n=1 Tax=Trypanosoma conorhini TaxID=83891 RepID=A0A3R7NM36_9TRYP|nr:uncharacterized protein Tco025E_02691 [Trypanosoma conorhini]RNF23954.1 hypothetical protein Tco025E_02691 [Trypanosoma conorhini]